MNTVSSNKLNLIKEDIVKSGKRRNSFIDEYNCGCSINPYFFTINKVCNRHFIMLNTN